jgi:glutathione S-transferase
VKLYVFPVAPNPTKLRSYVAEKGIAIEQVIVNLREGEQRRPGFRQKNPLGRLPVLELDDGECISESLPIIEYLEELHPDPPMIGRTPLERLRVRSAERLVDSGVLQAAALIVHSTRSPLGLPARPQMAEFFRARLDEALPLVDARLAAAPFVCGERPTIADCTLWAALGFARFGEVDIPAHHRHIARWRDDFAQRPGGRV